MRKSLSQIVERRKNQSINVLGQLAIYLWKKQCDVHFIPKGKINFKWYKRVNIKLKRKKERKEKEREGKEKHEEEQEIKGKGKLNFKKLQENQMTT